MGVKQGGHFGLKGQIFVFDPLHGGIHIPAVQHRPGHQQGGPGHGLFDLPDPGLTGQHPLPQGGGTGVGLRAAALQLPHRFLIDFPAVCHGAHPFL